MVAFLRFLQFLKASCSTCTLAGNETDVRPLQPSKALESISFRLVVTGTSVRAVFLKAFCPIVVTICGRSMCASALQSSKVPVSILSMFCGSVTFVSDRQPQNMLFSSFSRRAGSLASVSPVHAAKQLCPMVFTLLGTLMVLSARMLLKAPLPIFVTVAGMLISEMVEFIKALTPIDFRPIGSVTLFTFISQKAAPPISVTLNTWPAKRMDEGTV